ncbi:MAG: hypothetical protein KA715_01360 [Xanthomonadaceae bacterium]|nr:hypothetical protein [Xanthomonadaceae bacterium]
MQSLIVPLLALSQYLSYVDVDLWLLLRSPILLRLVSFYLFSILLIAFGIHYLLSKRKMWAYGVYFLLGLAPWSLLSVLLVIKNSSFAVAISNLMSLAFIVATGGFWIKYFSKSFYDSGRRWYQGAPHPIPGVNCVAGETVWRVSRLDREGAYVFLDRAKPIEFRASGKEVQKPYELSFEYRHEKIDIPAVLVHQSVAFTGFGFRFKVNDADLRKDLGDFIEKMRGYGYEN